MQNETLGHGVRTKLTKHQPYCIYFRYPIGCTVDIIVYAENLELHFIAKQYCMPPN